LIPDYGKMKKERDRLCKVKSALDDLGNSQHMQFTEMLKLTDSLERKPRV
jgi:hypothetical protein